MESPLPHLQIIQSKPGQIPKESKLLFAVPFLTQLHPLAVVKRQEVWTGNTVRKEGQATNSLAHVFKHCFCMFLYVFVMRKSWKNLYKWRASSMVHSHHPHLSGPRFLGRCRSGLSRAGHGLPPAAIGFAAPRCWGLWCSGANTAGSGTWDASIDRCPTWKYVQMWCDYLNNWSHDAVMWYHDKW